MSNDDDLSFDPTERVIPHGIESVRPVPRKAVPPGTPDQAPTQAHSSSTARPVQPPAIQAPRQSPRHRTPLAQAAAHMGRNAPPRAPVPPPPPPPPPPAPAPTPQPTAVAARPAKQITAAFEDIHLPSGFAPYEWKSISVRRLNIEELRAIVRARVSGNLRYLVRAVDATISQYADELTVGDFWYIMYWHRINSYKKSPFIIEWKCDNQEHVHNVTVGKQVKIEAEQYESMDEDARAKCIVVEAEGDNPAEYYMEVKLPAETLKNVMHVNGSNLITQELDLDDFLAKREAIESEYGVQITPQRLADLVDSLEQQENKRHERLKREEKEKKAADDGDIAMFIEAASEEDVVEDEEQAFIHRYAALMEPVHGLSLDERAQFLNTMDPDLLVDLEEFMEVAEHGVVESWNVKCKECGASKTITQSLDALTFLPSLQRGGLA